MVEMNVRDQRKFTLRGDLTEYLGRFHVRHGETQQLAAYIFEPMDTIKSILFRVQGTLPHGLHGNRRTTTDKYPAHRDVSCFSPVYHGWITRDVCLPQEG
jgi:hypothetical protein